MYFDEIKFPYFEEVICYCLKEKLKNHLNSKQLRFDGIYILNQSLVIG